MQSKYKINGIYILISIVGICLYLSTLFVISNSDRKIEPILNEQNMNLNITKEKNIDPKIDLQDFQDSNPINLITKNEFIYIVAVDSINVREKPSIKSNIIKKYKYMDEIKIINESNGWGAMENGGFVFMQLLQKK